jgi:hypothetical protein
MFLDIHDSLKLPESDARVRKPARSAAIAFRRILPLAVLGISPRGKQPTAEGPIPAKRARRRRTVRSKSPKSVFGMAGSNMTT